MKAHIVKLIKVNRKADDPRSVANIHLGTIKSDLSAKVGHDNNTMRVLYTDDVIFDYHSKHPGTDWLGIRDQYKHAEVKT
jgi:hypothetical protein